MHTFKLTTCGVLALFIFAGCARSPETITVNTPEGKQKFMAPLPATVYSMARLLESQGKHDEAEAMLRQLIAGHPSFMPAYQELAGSLVGRRQIDDALIVIGAGLKQSPRDPVLLNNAGMCELLRKDYSKALDSFKRAAQANPGDYRAQANLALTLAMQGEVPRARAIYMTFLTAEETEHNLQIIQKTKNTGTPRAGAAEGKN